MSPERKSIAKRLAEHLAGDGTMNDGDTDDLYREWHGIPEGDETDLEAVERWAWETANKNKTVRVPLGQTRFA